MKFLNLRTNKEFRAVFHIPDLEFHTSDEYDIQDKDIIFAFLSRKKYIISFKLSNYDYRTFTLKPLPNSLDFLTNTKS